MAPEALAKWNAWAEQRAIMAKLQLAWFEVPKPNALNPRTRNPPTKLGLPLWLSSNSRGLRYRNLEDTETLGFRYRNPRVFGTETTGF